MFTFLMSWNPRRAQWKDRPDLLRSLEQGQDTVTSWGVVSKQIRPGDRIFFIRLGVAPKGIFAFGAAISSSYLDSHWNETKQQQGKQARYVDIALTEMLDMDTEPLVGLEQLTDPPLNQMHWTIQGSGVMIQEPIADALENKWKFHFEKIRRHHE